jgi:hypothetical protein
MHYTSVLEEVLLLLNNNQSIVAIIGWLLVFLLGLQAQRASFRSSIKIDQYNKFTKQINRLRDYQWTRTGHHFQTDLLQELKKLYAAYDANNPLQSQLQLVNTWQNYVKMESESVNNFNVILEEVKDCLFDISFHTSGAQIALERFTTEAEETHIKLLQYVNKLGKIDPFDPPESLEFVEIADSALFSISDQTLQEVKLTIFNVLVSDIFRKQSKIPKQFQKTFRIKSTIELEIPEFGDKKNNVLKDDTLR